MKLFLSIQVTQLSMRRRNNNIATNFCDTSTVDPDVGDPSGGHLYKMKISIYVPPGGNVSTGGRRLGHQVIDRKQKFLRDAAVLQHYAAQNPRSGNAGAVREEQGNRQWAQRG